MFADRPGGIDRFSTAGQQHVALRHTGQGFPRRINTAKPADGVGELLIHLRICGRDVKNNIIDHRFGTGLRQFVEQLCLRSPVQHILVGLVQIDDPQLVGRAGPVKNKWQVIAQRDQRIADSQQREVADAHREHGSDQRGDNACGALRSAESTLVFPSLCCGHG